MGAFKILHGRSASPDPFPDAFTFTSQTNITLSSTVTSNTLTPVGYDTAAAVVVTGGTGSVNGGAFSATPGNIAPGQTLALRLSASASYSTLATATVSVGGALTGSFSVTTQADPASIPTVSPHANWTGAVGTGAATPTQPARTYFKPNCHFLIPSEQRFGPGFDVYVGVFADDCSGVDLTGDCAFTSNNAAPIIRTFTHPLTGATVTYPPARWFKLDGTAFAAVNGTTSKVRLYAVCHPNNASAQDRVIGGNSRGDVPGNDAATATNWCLAEANAGPMFLYPTALTAGSLYPFDKTVGAAGNYTTINAALTAAYNSGTGYDGVRITCIDDLSTHLVDSSVVGAGHYNDKMRGHPVIRSQPGKRVKINRQATFDRAASNDANWGTVWIWYCPFPCVRFEDIDFDMTNWTTIFTGTDRPSCFVGCKWFDSKNQSAGTNFTWNGSSRGEFSIIKASGSLTNSYFIGCDSAYVSALDGGAALLLHSSMYLPGTGRMIGAAGIFHGYVRGPECYHVTQADPARLTIRCNASTQTTAQVTISTQALGTGTTITLFENGSSVHVYTAPYCTQQNVYVSGIFVSEAVTALTAWSAGRAGGLANNWVFTEVTTVVTGNLGDDDLNITYLNQNGVGIQNAKNVDSTWHANEGVHSEPIQLQRNSSTDYRDYENYTMYGCRLVEVAYDTSIARLTDGVDTCIKNCAFDTYNNVVPLNSGLGIVGGGNFDQQPANWGGPSFSYQSAPTFLSLGVKVHNVVENNLFAAVYSVLTASANVQEGDETCSSRQNIILGLPSTDNGVSPWIDNIGCGTTPTPSATSSGNVSLGATLDETKITALFRNRGAFDFAAQPSSALDAKRVTPINPYDMDGNARDTSDTPGPSSRLAAAPSLIH